MRKIALLCVAALLSAVAVSTAQADGAEVPSAQQTTCAPKCEHWVTKRSFAGYREGHYIPGHYARVPVYHKRRVLVKDHCCGPKVATQPVKIPEPPPQVVHVPQKIIVVHVPEVVNAPTPPVEVINRPPPRFYRRPPIVIAPPPPAVVYHRQQLCCRVGGQPCPPVGSLTDDGLRVRVANAYPPVARPCVRMFHGRLVSGHCW